MEDSTRDMRAIQHKIWMSLSESDRFRQCGEMFELAKAFAASRAPKGLSPTELSRFIFRELYGFEKPENARDEIHL